MAAVRWLDVLVRELKLAAQALVRLPPLLYRWLVDNASRCVAIVWLAGMAFVVIVTVRRIIKLHREEAALIAGTRASPQTRVSMTQP